MATIKHIQTPDGVIHDVGGGGGNTYTLTKSGSTITLTGSGGDVSSVVDANTTYALSLSGHTLTLTPSSGSAQSVTIPDDNTTYTIGISGSTITLTPSSGTAQTITIPDATTSVAGVMSAADKTKLDGIASGAEVNVQSDWNENNSSSDAYIQNKPTIPTVNDGTLTIQQNGTTVDTFTANQSGNTTANITVPTATSDLNNDSGFTSVSVTQTLSSGTKIAEVDIDGTTTDLYAPSGGGGTITDVQLNGTSVVSGTIADIPIFGAPTTTTPGTDGAVPAPPVKSSPGDTKALSNNGNWVSIVPHFNQPTSGPNTGTTTLEVGGSTNPIPVATTTNSGAMSSTDKSKLDGVASGAEVNVQADWDQSNTSADDYIKNKPSLATVATTGDYDDLTNKPSLATVATTGDYDDLANKPTIPTVNDATLTIQKNGNTVETFTANSNTNKTANITVPTKTSDLTNDSNFVSDASYVHTDNNFTNSDVSKLSGIEAGAEVNVQSDWTQADSTADDYIKNKPTIPTVNNGTLTIQKNGTSVGTFTANQSGNTTANVTVPTATSDLTNDSGFTAVSVTQTLSSGTKIAEIDVDGTTTDLYAPSGGGGAVNDVEVNGVSVVSGGVASVTVPTATSDLTNDSNFVSDASYVHTDNNFTNADATKLSGIASGAEVNVQADWNEANSSSDAYIQNKPTIPTVNDATLTIQKNGTTVNTFTANASSNVTANITVPTTAADVGALADTTTYVSGVKGNAESSYRSGNVNVTPDNVGAVALADKYTRSSTGDLNWSSSTEGDSKVVAKSALAFWNGAYSGNSSNLSKCSTGNIIGSNGGTMTGQLKTSFNTSVAMGSYGSAQSTVPNFVAEVRYSSGCAGSVNFTSNYTANNVTILGGWYNFMYMPHRSGGNSGAADGDNANYGNLFLFGMNNTNGRFIVRVSSGSIADVCRIWTSLETAYGELHDMSSSLTLSTSAKKVALTTFNGIGCSLSSNGIKVTNAGTYMISGSAYCSTGYTVNDLIHIQLYKGSTSLCDSTRRALTANPYEIMPVGPVIVTLAANDVIYLYAHNQAGSRGTVATSTLTHISLHRIA